MRGWGMGGARTRMQPCRLLQNACSSLPCPGYRGHRKCPLMWMVIVTCPGWEWRWGGIISWETTLSIFVIWVPSHTFSAVSGLACAWVLCQVVLPSKSLPSWGLGVLIRESVVLRAKQGRRGDAGALSDQ